ncbi:MAG: type II toxin-antitoxin system VapC family toxin [Mucilaginibacter sp.]
MGRGYLADTNTLIDYLENKLPEKAIELIDNTEIQFSVISRIELLVWRNASEEQLQIIKNFIAISTVFNLDEDIILQSIEIRKNYRLKLPDAIIAATAVVKNLTLLTRNMKDFELVSGLVSANPYSL